MKRSFLISIFILSINYITANPNHEVIFNSTYKNLPFSLEIENSGIYSIASFDIASDTIEFSSFNAPGIYKFYSDKFINQTISNFPGKDFLSEVKIDRVSTLNKFADNGNIADQLYRKNFLNKSSYLIDNNGELTGINNESIRIIVKNRDQLVVESENLNLSLNITLDFPNNLACADLIGIDGNGNMFLVIEKYLSEVPLKVSREVYTISNNG